MQGTFSISNDKNLFLMIFPHRSLHCKLTPVQFWEYRYGLINNNSKTKYWYRTVYSGKNSTTTVSNTQLHGNIYISIFDYTITPACSAHCSVSFLVLVIQITVFVTLTKTTDNEGCLHNINAKEIKFGFCPLSQWLLIKCLA